MPQVAQANNLAQSDVLRDNRSPVRFGQERAWFGIKKMPAFKTFPGYLTRPNLPANTSDPDLDKFPGIDSFFLPYKNNATYLGQNTLRHDVKFPMDAIFHLHYVKMVVQYLEEGESRQVGERYWRRFDDAGSPTLLPHTIEHLRTLQEVLRVHVIIPSGGSRSLGSGVDQSVDGLGNTSNSGVFRIPLSNLQGDWDGMSQDRQEYIIPRGGTVTIELENVGARDLRVKGMLMGLKVFV
jgi:hypothetical protein